MSINRELFDATVELHLDIERVAMSVRGDVVKLIQTMQKELIAKLASENLTEWSKSRINKLLKESDIIINQYYGDIKTMAIDSTTSIAQAAVTNTLTSLSLATAGQIALSSLPTVSMLEIIAGETIVQGATQKDWWDRQSNDLSFRFKSAVRQGMVSSDTTPQIIKRVREATDLAKRNAETLVHTSVQSVANTAREKTFNENSDVIKGFEWVSALDRRTCPTCGIRDGKQWTLEGKGMNTPIPYSVPPLHFRCRCSMAPVLKPIAELGIDFNNMPNSTRASIEGQVTDKTFEEWLKRKVASNPNYADQTLGKGRAELWRSGKITFDQMINGSKLMTLQQLKDKYL